MLYRKILILMLVIVASKLFSQDIDFYGIVKNVKSFGNKIPSISYPDNITQRIKSDDKIFTNGIILTDSEQFVEIALYNKDKSIGFVSIKENSDISFAVKDNKLLIKINYGRCRVVLNSDLKVSFFTKDFLIQSRESCDFGYQSILENGVDSKGYFIVFEGNLNLELLNGKGVTKNIKKWEIQNFLNNTLSPVEEFSAEMLKSWKDSMIFVSKFIPDNLNLVLEKLDFATKVKFSTNVVPENDVTEDVVEEVESDVTTDVKVETVVKKEKTPIDKNLIMLSFLSFEVGGLWYDIDYQNIKFDNLGVKFAWRPGLSLFNNKFEYGFYFNLNIFPLKFQSSNLWEAFGYINPNSCFRNSEFSFGSDHYPNVGRMVFDIFDDLFSKIRILRYNQASDMIFFQAGEYNYINDDANFLLFDFNPKYYSLYQRKTSVYTSFNFNFFKAFIYAEDILPKGLYGTNFNIATPSKSFRVKFDGGVFFDCYDAIKFNENEKWSMLSNFYAGLTIDTFNLPSFGLSFYLNSGIFIPFNSEITNYDNIVLSGLNFTFGSRIRFKDLLFSFEFVKDSVLSKIGMFDFGYSFNRDKKFILVYDYLEDVKNRTNINDYFKDQYFGFRAKLNFDLIKYVIVDFSMQLGVSSKYPDHFGLDLLNKIYDRVYFKLIIDSKDKWKDFNINFYALWSIGNIVNSIIENDINKSFVENNVAFAGLSISPIKALEINLVFGIHPLVTTLVFSSEISLIIKPVFFNKTKKVDKKSSKNL